MNVADLNSLFSIIRNCPFYNDADPPCQRIKKFKPVINTYSSAQRFMVISSDPSGDTDKKLDDTVPHSDFALRFITLVFTGNDSDTSVAIVKRHYPEFQKMFDKYYYWTHYSKCYAQGNPKSHCANTYLKKEIDHVNPTLIISLGSKPVDFLLGKDKLSNRVNKILYYDNIPIIASLHPSRDWNLSRRPMYKFIETWQLIRKTVKYSPEDVAIIDHLQKE